MGFQIDYDKQPIRFLRSCDNHVLFRIVSKIEDILSEDPVPHNSKRIVKEKGLAFGVRIGDYRILYRVNFDTKKIIVFRVDKRGRVYG